MADERLPIRQVEEPCPSCGSFYRRGDCCNACGMLAPVAQAVAQPFAAGKETRGKTWLKAQHRYLRQGETLPV
jgi:methionyl-tRNA synthetase